MREEHFKSGVGCSVCSGRKVLPGYNDVSTTDPNIAQYIYPSSQAQQVTRMSCKPVTVKCPQCGCVKKQPVSSLVRRGFKCPICCSGISYPNRFMAALLTFCNISFESEKIFTWSKPYRYDFYLPDFNTIIEMNGAQHYDDNSSGWGNFEEQRERDNLKRTLSDGRVQHYLSIPATKSTLDDTKRNIISSGLLDIIGIPIPAIDWEHIALATEDKTAFLCASEWNNGNTNVANIADLLGIHKTTVVKYLKRFSDLGLCSYSPDDEREKCRQTAIAARRRPVRCINTGEEFDSIEDAAKMAGVKPNAIQNCVAKRCKHAGKDINGHALAWEYIKE